MRLVGGAALAVCCQEAKEGTTSTRTKGTKGKSWL